METVAPHAGAWIETLVEGRAGGIVQAVAPHAGAWIETQLQGHAQLGVASHPTRVRGLKR